MNKLKEWIKQHQLIAFFILTYLITWLLMAPYLLTGGNELFGILIIVGIFGPALTNIIISRIVEPVPSGNPRHQRWITFLVTWVIATVIFTLNVKTTSVIQSPVAIVIFAIFGLLPAFVWSSAFSKFPGVSRSLSSLVKPKGHVGYYLFALLIPPVIKLISIPIAIQLGLAALSTPDRVDGALQLVTLITVSFLYGFVFTGGLNEETGWTGFALPRLQVRYNPFIASIVLWFFWILWHIPMQVTGFWNPDLTSFIRVLIGTFFARFMFTWLYNRTNGGILVAMIFHVSANTSFMFLPATHVQMGLEALLAVFIVIFARMWVKLPSDSPATYRISEEAT